MIVAPESWGLVVRLMSGHKGVKIWVCAQRSGRSSYKRLEISKSSPVFSTYFGLAIIGLNDDSLPIAMVGS